MTNLRGAAYWAALVVLGMCLVVSQAGLSPVEAQVGLPPQHGGLGFGTPGGMSSISGYAAGCLVKGTSASSLGCSIATDNGTGSITIASGTLTASHPGLIITQTWNNPVVSFVGLDIDITSSSSQNGSAFIRGQIGGVDTFHVLKSGYGYFAQTVASDVGFLAPAANNCASVPYSFSGATDTGICSSSAGAVAMRAGGYNMIDCTSGGCANLGYFDTPGLVLSSQTYLKSDAANTLAQRNGTAAQTFNWYYQWADASNYQRGALKTSATGISIEAETAGSGADNLDVTLTPAGTGTVVLNGYLTSPTYYIKSQHHDPIAVDSFDLGGAIPWRYLWVNRGIYGNKSKDLTDAAAAAAFVRVAVPQTVGSNYAGGDVIWTAFAADATPHTQSLSGRLTFTAINNAGTEVCVMDPTAAVTAPNANSSGTLSCTFSCASNAADTIDLMATCDTSLGTPTALTILYRLDMPQPNTVTPQ